MQSDFELMEYARGRKIALRKNGLIMLTAGLLLLILIQLKLVAGWMTILIFIMVFVLGIVQPIRYRLKNHPDRKSTRLNSSHVLRSRMPSSA